MGCVKSKVEPIRQGSKHFTISAASFVQASRKKYFESYEIIKTLGAGAFSEVKLCNHLPTGQKRALKIIHKSGLSEHHADTKLLLKEIQVLKSLDHPSILRCYEILEDRRHFYIATEYCEGGELFQMILEKGKLTEADTAEIMFQLLSAVTYCHENRVIHRDLKPENILLEEKEGGLSIRVADFGSSCLLDPRERTKGCYGSAYYIAPEVLKGEYNEKCDEWSCGVIMYILLTGTPPYFGNSDREILRQVKNQPIQVSVIPGISKEACDLLSRLLQRKPRKRIDAKVAVNHPWINKFRKKPQTSRMETTLTNLRKFNATEKLKGAVHIFLATHVLSSKDLKELKESFHAMDVNGDGILSKQELVKAYKEIMGEKKALETVNEIMNKVDDDHNGYIDYSEFLKSCVDYTNHLSKENLETAFRMFDKDGSGTITSEELKETLGQENEDQNIWKQIIEEVDQNGDGVIDLKEFLSLMTGKI